MRNLATKFGKIFDICKKFSKNLVDERGSLLYSKSTNPISPTSFLVASTMIVVSSPPTYANKYERTLLKR